MIETIKRIMRTDGWVIFINVMRILTFVLLFFLIAYLVKEIEIVKLLGGDPCKICMNKTGCQCFCMEGFG